MTRENSIQRLETILFDFDGTLVNTTPLILRSFRETWQAHRGFNFSDEIYISTFGTHLQSAIGNLIDLGVETGRHAALPDRETEIGEMLKTYRKINLSWHDSMVEPFPGVDQMLEHLRQRRVRLGIVSSKMRAGVERGLGLFNLGGYFEQIIAAEDVSRHKPDPEPICLALTRLGAPAEKTLYLGDSTHDIHAGQAAAVRTAAAAWGPFPRHVLADTAPDYILDSPGDVRTIIDALSGAHAPGLLNETTPAVKDQGFG
ncbi:MAG: HAD-IA family hydrolase [Acidobacteriota bacterium]